MKNKTGALHASVGFSSRGGGFIRDTTTEKTIIGYQIKHEYLFPDDFKRWEILSGPLAQNWIRDHDEDQKYWSIVAVYVGDINDPVFVN